MLADLVQASYSINELGAHILGVIGQEAEAS
ncbi:hypothetical protein ES703_90533 [subsurface metagenome]